MTKLPNWLLYSLVVVITGVWVTSFIVSLFDTGYSPPDSINLLFSSLVGGLLIGASGRRNRDDDDDKEEELEASRKDRERRREGSGQ